MSKISKKYFNELLSMIDKQEVKDFLISNEKKLVYYDLVKVGDRIKTFSDIIKFDNQKMYLLMGTIQIIYFIETGEIPKHSYLITVDGFPKTEKIFNTYFDIDKLILNKDDVFEEIPYYYDNIQFDDKYIMQLLLDVLKSHKHTELNMSKKFNVQDLCGYYIYVEKDNFYNDKIQLGIDKLYNLIYKLDNMSKAERQYFKIFYKQSEVK